VISRASGSGFGRCISVKNTVHHRPAFEPRGSMFETGSRDEEPLAQNGV